MKQTYIFLISIFIFLILAGCGIDKENAESLNENKEMDELTPFEKEVKEIVIDQVGLKDEDGNNRIEDILVLDGEDGEKMIEKIEQDDSQKNPDTNTKAMMRETVISMTINSTQDEYGRAADTAYIFQELYNKYDPDRVSIWWNISDVPDEDAKMFFELEKRTEEGLNWDDVLDGEIGISTSFTKDIDTFIDWPIK